jgi:DNA processing protein
MSREELALWLRLCNCEGIGPVAVIKLLKSFGLPAQVFSHNHATLCKAVTAAQATSLLAPNETAETLIEATWQWLHNAPAVSHRRVVSWADADYPRLLLTLPDPPPLLFVMGSQAVYSALAEQELACDIAIVGSRNATPQGLQNARSFAKTFSLAGMNVVSGLALGIDGAAHEGALDAQQDMGSGAGATIAVVGTGLDRVYPKRHHDLAHRIAQSGLIISEFLIGTPPLAENFPRRNRIIAALSQGTLVVEAAIQSGSLITARQALDLGKEVFAIPGSIHSPQSKGCHHLIKQGAKLVESAQDVIEELVIKPTLRRSNAMISGALHAETTASMVQDACENEGENPLLQALGHDPMSLDALIDRTGIPAAQLQVQLLELELLGEIARLPGGLFQRQALS